MENYKTSQEQYYIKKGIQALIEDKMDDDMYVDGSPTFYESKSRIAGTIHLLTKLQEYNDKFFGKDEYPNL